MSAELLASRPPESESTLVLTLSNPGARNALHPDMYAAGIQALETAERDTSIRAVVLIGADDFFCAGGNLNRLLENRAKDPSVQAQSIDLLAQWIEDCCELGKAHGDTSADLFASWRAYALGRSEDPRSAKWFGTMLERQGFEADRDCPLFRGRGFRGLRVKPAPAAAHWQDRDT